MHAQREISYQAERIGTLAQTKLSQEVWLKGFFKKFSCPPIKGNRNTLKLVLQIETVFILEFFNRFLMTETDK